MEPQSTLIVDDTEFIDEPPETPTDYDGPIPAGEMPVSPAGTTEGEAP